MGWWQVNADTLAGSRFVLSPLAEATASLIALERGAAGHPGERTWLDTHQPAYRERLAGDPVTALLVRAALGRHWIADFLTVTPAGEGEPTLGDELARMRERPPEAARADLTVSLGGPLPARLHRSDLPERAADLLEWVWTETVLPYWPRRRRIMEADIVARTRELSQGGWAAALADMRPGMRWLGEGRLQINAHDYPPRKIAGAQLLFVPVTPRQGWVSWDAPHRYAVDVPVLGRAGRGGPGAGARGAGNAARARPGGRSGPPRHPEKHDAAGGADRPGAGLGGPPPQGPARRRLVQRRRAGRSVLYYRTAAGETLLEAQRDR